MKFKISDYNIPFYTVILTIAVLYSIIYYFTPALIDDLQFVSVYHGYSGGSDSFSLEAWLEYINELRQNDNSRISNMMSPMSTIITPWCRLFPFISGIITAGIVWMIVKIVDYKSRNKVVMAAIVWFMVVLFLPWRNNILVADYQLNYTYSAIISLLFVTAVVKFEKQGWSTSKLLLMLVFAVIGGGWHEGFALPVAGGLGVWALTRRLKMSRQWYAVVVVFVVAALLFAISPGMLKRAVREVESPMMVNYIKFTADLILVFFTVFIITVSVLWKRTREVAKKTFGQPVFLIFFTSMILSTLLSIVFDHSARTAFWPEMCAIISLLIFIKPVVERWFEKRLIRVGVEICCLAACIAHACIIIHWQKIFYNENREILSLIENGERTIYRDIVMPESVPVYTLYFPTRTSWITPFHYQCLGNLIGCEDISVVPVALADACVANSERIDGDVNLYRKGDALWMYPYDGLDTFHELFVDIVKDDGSEIFFHTAYARHFVTENGDTLVYFKAHKLDSRDIVKVDFAK